ncbi:MAG: hypothetical protein EYR95_14055, partial [Phormidium sp. SL48-SHIP]
EQGTGNREQGTGNTGTGNTGTGNRVCLLPLAIPSWEGLGVGYASCLLPFYPLFFVRFRPTFAISGVSERRLLGIEVETFGCLNTVLRHWLES